MLNICPLKKRKDLVEKIRQCFNSESKVKDQMVLVNFTVNNIEAMGEMDFGDLSKFSLRQLVDKLLSGPALSQQNEREVLNAILKKFDKNSKKELSSVERLSLIEKFMQSKLDFSNLLT